MDNSLAKKLQVKAGRKLLVLGTPNDLAPLLEGAATSGRGPFDIVLVFAADRAVLGKQAKTAIAALGDDAILWIAYPKKSSALASDLDRDHGWEPIAAAGFDPVSQVAIDETWSALRWKRDPALRAARIARGSTLAPAPATKPPASPRASSAAKKPKTAELKSRPTASSVAAFIESVPDETRRKDSQALLVLMRRITGVAPKMWGGSIVGFGDVHLKYDSGRELDWFACGFSPRKDSLSIYGLIQQDGTTDDLLDRLGRHTTGKGCLYVKKLADIDMNVLAQLIERAVLPSPITRAAARS